MNNSDPYAELMLSVVKQAFVDIHAYFFYPNKSTYIANGELAIKWIENREGTFNLCAEASGMSIDNFYELCNRQIKEIKENAEFYCEISEYVKNLEKENQTDDIKKMLFDYKHLKTYLLAL